MIPVNKFKLLTSDRKIILNALKRNWISSAGPEVKKFEDNLKLMMDISEQKLEVGVDKYLKNVYKLHKK